jgi:Sec-independent protein translocase protein TatA
MPNLGIGELTVIFIVLILAVGPDRMPTLMRSIGKALRTVQRASRELRTAVGFDELMRGDVLAPPTRRTPPMGALSRDNSVAASRISRCCVAD